MAIVKDKIVLGTLAGILSNVVVTIIDIVFYHLGVNQFVHFHIAASAFFPSSEVYNTSALIIGAVADFALAAFLGVVIAYTLYFTGSDYFYIKGIGVGLTFWLLIYGIVLRLKIARIDPIDSGTNLVHLTIHLILGFLSSWIIAKHGMQTRKSHW